MARIRVPEKKIFNWFASNFGVSGFENYDPKQVETVLKALYQLLYVCGSYELYFIGKVLLKLSDHPELQEKFLAELELFK